METTQRVVRAIGTLRLGEEMPEETVQQRVAQALSENGIGFVKEAVLGPGCRVDFLAEGSVAVEVKARFVPAGALKKQLLRYGAFDAVSAVVVASVEPVRAPKCVCGKPVEVVCLRSLWGVAL